MEDEEASIEEEVEDSTEVEDSIVVVVEEAEVAVEAVLTGSKTTDLQNMLLVRSWTGQQWLLLVQGKPSDAKHVIVCKWNSQLITFVLWSCSTGRVHASL